MTGDTISRIASAVVDLALIPIFVLSHLAPRDDAISVYGYSNGESFTDNGKYQFLHANGDEPGTRPVWLTRDDDVLAALRGEGYEAYRFRSVGGVLCTLRAGTVFVTHSRRDVPWYATGGAEVVRLGHGIPFKKYGRADPGYGERKETLKRLAYERTVGRFSSSIATADSYAPYVAEATGLDERDVHVTGLPRMDMPHVPREARQLYCDDGLLETLRTDLADSRIVFYFPTWRDGDASPIPEGLDFEVLEAALRETDSYLLTRPHTNTAGGSGWDVDADGLERVIALDTDADFYPIFEHVDLFVTDYSSLFHDAVYYDTPVLFFAHDLSRYTERREFFFEYESVPGEVLTTPAGFHERFRAVLEDLEGYERRYEGALEEWRDETYDYQDGKNCERVSRTFVATGRDDS